MFVRLYNENPNPRTVRQVVEVLQDGGIIIYPTDTVYAFGCSLQHPKALSRIRKIKQLSEKENSFSILCKDLSQLSLYTRSISTPIFKLIKRNTPGPFTFIFNASSQTPKLFQSKKKTIGIRVPESNIVKAIIDELGYPIISSSLHAKDEITDYLTDPELIDEEFGNQVDMVVDGSYGQIIPSTVVDCTSGEPEIIRQGLGELLL